MHEPILRARDVVVRRGPRLLVDGVSFDLEPAQILAIVGPNGAGKSTLLRALLGLLPLTSGRVIIEGQRLESLSPSRRAMTMAYVPQQSALNIDLTVESVVRMGRFAHRQSANSRNLDHQSAVDEAMRACHIEPFRERNFLSLSGGERARVLLARALATEARILLLDEPCQNLDIAHQLELLSCLKDLARHGKAIAMVTHDLNHLDGFADQMLVLKSGRTEGIFEPTRRHIEARLADVFRVRLLADTAFGYARRT